MTLICASAALVLSYVLGSVSSAHAFGRLLKGIDLREHGSGNLGATNAYRVLGPWVAATIFAVDFGKGALAVYAAAWAAARFGASPEVVAVVGGLGVIVGHTWPFYLGFKGGKGVATGAGVVLALSGWKIVVALLAMFVVVVALTRFVSLGSVAMAAAFPLLVAWLHWGNVPLVVFALLAAALVIFNHRGNIRRLATGREQRLGESPDGPGEPNA